MVHDPMLWEREYEPEDFPLYDILPPDESQFEVIDHVIGKFRDEKYIIGYAGREAGFVLLGGMERGLTEYLSNPEGVQAAIDQATALGNQEDAYFIRPGQDAVFWGQDFAYNSGPLMAPKLFNEMVLPSVKQRVENAKSHGVAVFKHCCGNTKDLRDFFLEAGYDCYQSLQKQAGMDLRQLWQLYGNRMCLWGGIDVANLIGGSREQVRQETMEAIKIAKQGGVILGSSHSISTGCNYDNVMTMMETISCTAPSWVIFWATLSGAFNSFICHHLPFRRDRYRHRRRSRSPRYSGKWDRPGAGRPRSPGFSAAGPARPCARSCGGLLPAPAPRGYVRPSFRESHKPFHPVRVQRRRIRYRPLLEYHLRRQVPVVLRRIVGRWFQGGAEPVRRHRGHIEHRRRQGQAPDRPIFVPLAENPIFGQEHIQACRVPGSPLVGGKGRGKHQPRR